MTPEAQKPQISEQLQKQDATKKIKRPQRKKGKTYDTEETPYTENHKSFGKVLLRKEWGSELDMDPVDLAKFVKACIAYAKKKGRLDVLEADLKTLAEEIRSIIDENPGLTGIESERLDSSVTDVLQNKIESDKADVIAVREKSGPAFPQFANEVVIFSVTVPEEDVEKENTRQRIDVEKMIQNFKLFMLFSGLSDEAQSTNVKVERRMKVTDRARLFELLDKEVLTREMVGVKTDRRLEVKSLTQSPEPQNGENGNSTESN